MNWDLQHAPGLSDQTLAKIKDLLGFVCSYIDQHPSLNESSVLRPASITPSDTAALRLHWDSEGIFRFPDQLVSLRIGEPVHHCGDLLAVKVEEKVMVVRK